MGHVFDESHRQGHPTLGVPMSGLVSKPFIDSLLQQTDIVSLIDAYVPLKKQGGSYVACCPFHQEKSPSFHVTPQKQFYHCFGCNASGNAIGFIMNYLNEGFVEAIELLATRLGLTVIREGEATQQEVRSRDLYQLLQQVSIYYQKQLKENGKTAIDYLRKRGLSGDIAKRYQLGFALDGWHHLEKVFTQNKEALLTTGMLIQNEQGNLYDRYRNRIMFPIHDKRGRIIAFGGRVLQPEQKPKYLNSPETVLFQKNRELYGLYQILSLKKNIDFIIVVEGYMDVIALAQHGISNAVATLGTATSTYHIQLLAKYTQRLIFCFDGDEAGKQAAWRALESSLPHMHSGLDVRFIFLSAQHDPDSFVRTEGKELFLKFIDEAKPLHRFLFDITQAKVNLSTPAGKTQFIHDLTPALKKIAEGAYKQLLLDEIARLTHLDPHRLDQMIAKGIQTAVQNNESSIMRSPMHIALALLLQNPERYPLCAQHVQLNQLHEQEQAMLISLIQQLEANPEANTARLIEAWRGSAHFDFIMQLAAWNHQVPEAELTKELIDTLLFLQKNNEEQRIHQLIHKSRNKSLDEGEKILLQKLLKERHDIGA